MMKEFDETEAIKQMRQALPVDVGSTYSDDELLNLLDIIWDYYEQNGLLDITAEDEDDDPDTIFSELCDYACRMLRKDRSATLDPKWVEPLVKAEIDYEESLLND